MHKRYQHPELQDDEMFLVNVYVKTVFGGTIFISTQFKNENWGTKRLGGLAYDADGKILPNMRPVIVKKSEAEQKGFDYNSVGSIVASYYG